MQIEKQVTIIFRWWNDDVDEIDLGHAEALEEIAWDRITGLMKEGFTSGELNDNIRMDDTDPEDGIEYRGWWGLKWQTI